MYCQSCGAENANDARFCNMCGAKIASSGEPGGPVTAAGGAPAGGGASTAGFGSGGTNTTMSGSSVSLAAIGVRSPAAVYGILIGGAVLAFALGPIAMFVAMRAPDAAPAQAAADTETDELPFDDEVEMGDPVPAGELPDEGDAVTSGPRPTKRSTGGSTRPSGGSSGASSGGGSGSAGGGGGGSASSGSGSGSAGSGGSGSGSGSAGSGGSGSAGSGGSGSAGSGSAGSGSTETGSGSSGSGGAGGGSTGTGSGSGGGGSEDWERIGEGLEDPAERRMDLYTNGIRRIIRDHYLARAQTCFSHASRTDEDVRGTVIVEFTIAANGHAEGAHVVRNSTGNDALGACLARAVDQWQLARPPDGPMEMQMPFSR